MNTDPSYLIIGASAAGIAAIEAIRQCDPERSITVISDEDHGPYSRCLISYYLAGTRKKNNLLFRDKDFFSANRVRFLPGRTAVRLNTDRGMVILDDGEEIPYRAVLLATGGVPNFPEIGGIEAEGVVTMRTLNDAEKMISLSAGGGRAVILGGGLIGCKAAYGLRERGMETTIVIRSDRVLSQMLDLAAAEIFREKFEEHGTTILTGSSVREILTENGTVTGVKLANGEIIPCRMVVLGKGVAPRMELTEGTGIKTERGILVDEHMATSVKGVYAAGDVARAPDVFGGTTVNSLWPVASEQGKIAGYNMAGRGEIYPGSLGMNSIGFYGIDVIAAGKVSGLTENQEAVIRDHSRQDVYKKLVIEDGRPIGLILLGEINSAGVIISLIKQGGDIRRLKEIILGRNFGYGQAIGADRIESFVDFPALKMLNAKLAPSAPI